MPMHPAIQTHQTVLEKWRRAMDLIGPGPSDPHFQDAIGAVSGLDATGQWADLGSGAGFPGIALAALHPNANVWLVESRLKRATFLERVVAEAALSNATVRHHRTERLDDACLDGVISRAYKPPPRFLEDAARLLRPGGRAVLMLGDSDPLPATNGWTHLSSHRYAVADGHRLRQILRWDAA